MVDGEVLTLECRTIEVLPSALRVVVWGSAVPNNRDIKNPCRKSEENGKKKDWGLKLRGGIGGASRSMPC